MSFSNEQLIALRYALEDPEIGGKVATLRLLPTEEGKVAVFQAIGAKMNQAHETCANCRMARYQHIKDKCLFESTTFKHWDQTAVESFKDWWADKQTMAKPQRKQQVEGVWNKQLIYGSFAVRKP